METIEADRAIPREIIVEEPGTLRGDQISEVPEHLSLLLMLGNKFVPFPDSNHFLSRLCKANSYELEDLKCVLVCTTFHDKFPNSSRDSYPSFDNFPYKRLYVKKGTTPNTCVEEKIQQEVWLIYSSLKVVLKQVRTYIEHLGNTRIVHGVGFKVHVLQAFLSDHIFMASDKDGGSFIVLKVAYLREPSAHMRGQLHGPNVYMKVEKARVAGLWEEEAKIWQQKWIQVNLPFLPPTMLAFLQNVLDFQHKQCLPNFCLLARTNKEGFGLKPSGRFPTRPAVGMFRWATTPSCILLATMGTVLLKIDRHHDSTYSPILDTLDLLKRLGSFSLDPGLGADGRVWCISTFDVESLYTTFRWSDISMAIDFAAPTFSNMNPMLYPFQAMNVYLDIV